MSVSMSGVDHDSWGLLNLAAVFILGMAVLIVCAFVLGLALLQSWEAESLLRCSLWSISAAPFGGYF